jgi:hypothetical protein
MEAKTLFRATAAVTVNARGHAVATSGDGSAGTAW